MIRICCIQRKLFSILKSSYEYLSCISALIICINKYTKINLWLILSSFIILETKETKERV